MFGGGVNCYGSESDYFIVADCFGEGLCLIVSNFFRVPGPIVLLLIFLKVVDLVFPVKFYVHIDSVLNLSIFPVAPIELNVSLTRIDH